jgi:probable F420-dependent oxidoreductase
MKFGVMFANTGFGSSPDGAIAIARAAEAGGFDTLWTVEHVVPSGYESAYPYDPSGKMAGGAEVFDLPDPLIWLTWAAAHTERIRLATGVLVLPQRNVVITAKEIATLDHLSGGRVTLGAGVGWLAEEFAALGVPFAERGARMDEYIDVLRELWAPSGDPEKATVAGRFVTFTDCIMRPRPAQGTVPIVIGGHSPAAARRAGRRGDGFFPGGGTLEELAEMFAIVRAEAETVGRDPDAIELYSGGGRPGPKLDARIEQLTELGVTHLVVPAAPADELAEIGRDLVQRFGSGRLRA